MKKALFILLPALAAACTKYNQLEDARLQGTWRSNRDATVAAAFKRDPRWTNAGPQKVQDFRNTFGNLAVTYGQGSITTDFKGEISTFHYRVVEKGSNYVDILSDAPLDGNRPKRLHFVDGDSAYWISWGIFGIEERFDRVKTDER